MQLAERRGLPALPRDAAIAVLRHAIDRGVNHIDTAEFYGAGACNELIRAALHPYPAHLPLVGKGGAGRTAGGRRAARAPAAAGPAAARPREQRGASGEATLASLSVERLAVVNLRRLDA